MIDQVWWKNEFKQFEPARYEALLGRVIDHLNAGNTAALRRPTSSADGTPSSPIPYRFVGEYATHAYFREHHVPARTCATTSTTASRLDDDQRAVVRCDPDRDGTAQPAAVIIDMKNRVGLVARLGRLLRSGQEDHVHRHELRACRPRASSSMHCSANVGDDGDAASSSASRAPARPPCRPTPTASSSATTSTSGPTTASPTSRTAATPSSSTSTRTTSRSSRPRCR